MRKPKKRPASSKGTMAEQLAAATGTQETDAGEGGESGEAAPAAETGTETAAALDKSDGKGKGKGKGRKAVKVADADPDPDAKADPDGGETDPKGGEDSDPGAGGEPGAPETAGGPVGAGDPSGGDPTKPQYIWSLPKEKCFICTHLLVGMPETLPAKGGPAPVRQKAYKCIDEEICPARYARFVYDPFRRDVIEKAVETWLAEGDITPLTDLYTQADSTSVEVRDKFHETVVAIRAERTTAA